MLGCDELTKSALLLNTILMSKFVLGVPNFLFYNFSALSTLSVLHFIGADSCVLCGQLFVEIV